MRKKGKPILILAFFLIICFEINLFFSYAQGVEYIASGLRDPFENQLPQPEPIIVEKPASASETPQEPVRPPEFTVEGIVSGGPIPQAVIQDKVVRIGDTVEEALITNITKEGVEVTYEGETFVIPAPSKVVKPTQGGKNVQ